MNLPVFAIILATTLITASVLMPIEKQDVPIITEDIPKSAIDVNMQYGTVTSEIIRHPNQIEINDAKSWANFEHDCDKIEERINMSEGEIREIWVNRHMEINC